jgi:hypothetical protein
MLLTNSCLLAKSLLTAGAEKRGPVQRALWRLVCKQPSRPEGWQLAADRLREMLLFKHETCFLVSQQKSTWHGLAASRRLQRHLAQSF